MDAQTRGSHGLAFHILVYYTVSQKKHFCNCSIFGTNGSTAFNFGTVKTSCSNNNLMYVIFILTVNTGNKLICC